MASSWTEVGPRFEALSKDDILSLLETAWKSDSVDIRQQLAASAQERLRSSWVEDDPAVMLEHDWRCIDKDSGGATSEMLIKSALANGAKSYSLGRRFCDGSGCK